MGGRRPVSKPSNSTYAFRSWHWPHIRSARSSRDFRHTLRSIRLAHDAAVDSGTPTWQHESTTDHTKGLVDLGASEPPSHLHRFALRLGCDRRELPPSPSRES
jgi:hypothetical protein